MKMGDGGFRPAYNVQYGTDTESQVIVGVAVVSAGSDQGQMAPMVQQVAERCGQTPEEWLVGRAPKWPREFHWRRRIVRDIQKTSLGPRRGDRPIA